MVFALPRGGKEGRKLAHTYLTLFKAGEWDALIQRQAHHIGDSKGKFDKYKRAESLSRVGFFSGAARALVGGKTADPSLNEVYDKLSLLHPAAKRMTILKTQYAF